MDELTREMGCTLAEFERWLPGATRDARIDSTANAYRVHADGGMVDITLLECPPRRIASLALPVLSVCFRFSGMTQAARAAFLAYFDNYTRRGGG
ncbi:MAG: hypothetical protein V4632_14305 [Pseudomonadota bacterium]